MNNKKKIKINHSNEDYWNLKVNDNSIQSHYKLKFINSNPYKHCIIDNILNDNLLRSCRNVLDNVAFTRKETDIYSLNQTGDLANLDGLNDDEAKKLKSLATLRNCLYSNSFLKFVENVTGCSPLSSKIIDMAFNKYDTGCFLLNHDDVIGTRSISYILYLVDPDSEWLVEYGGSLELYPTKSKGVPCEAPSTVIAPAWNRIVMFPVVPGFSFHSVEEVVGPGKERYSLQGWFHYAQEGEAGYDLGSIPEGLKQNSTLNQLLNAANDKFLVYKNPLPLDTPLSPDDIKVLTEFMNPEYLKLQSIEKIRDTFLDESKVNLQDFLNVETAKKMGLYISKMDNKCHFNPIKMTPHGTGVEEGWEVEGPPHVKRHLVFRPEKVDLNTNIFKVVLDGLKSNSFRKWLSLIGSSVLESYHIIARRFRPGLDYTLATPNKTTCLDINLGLTPTHPVWDDGEHGGYECYMANDATEQDAAVYRVDAKDDVLLTTMANWNILTIALRDEGVLKFVKYVSNQCARSRYDIEGEFPVVYDDE